jgi:hypothetical protein
MSDYVENSDEEIQIKAFKEAADFIDRILEDVKFFLVLVFKNLFQLLSLLKQF